MIAAGCVRGGSDYEAGETKRTKTHIGIDDRRKKGYLGIVPAYIVKRKF